MAFKKDGLLVPKGSSKKRASFAWMKNKAQKMIKKGSRKFFELPSGRCFTG